MSGRFTVRAPKSQVGKKTDGSVVCAWLSLAFYPLSFVVAFVVGQALLSWYGYSAELIVPVWIAAAAAGPALIVFSVPGILAVRYGRQAMRRGNHRGHAPAVAGAAIAVGMIALNLLSGIAQIFFG